MAEVDDEYKVVVVGAGPAGLQAALFLARADLRTLVLGDIEDSDLEKGKVIGNYFGVPEEPPGIELLKGGVKQVERYEGEVKKEEAVDVHPRDDGGFVIETDAMNHYGCEALLIASGKPVKKAGIENEEEFMGNGIHTCAACDGPLYKDATLRIVGNGNHAAQEALELLPYTEDIKIYSQGAEWQIRDEMLDRLEEKGVEREEKQVQEAHGDDAVSRIVFEDGDEEEVDAIFLAVGKASGISFGEKLGLKLEDGNVKIDRDTGKTSERMVWAAGDVTGSYPYLATAAGSGCNAAMSIIRTMRDIPEYIDYD
ncbi:MAG: NAD(P)/FAD-dependent oxidoreductase [Candidatus Nanohaloarchaea archaeon]|nr:NAD(P)/FAD-dependent oxidoreductase [Candidatus Nanohaloarchaea archaeon]